MTKSFKLSHGSEYGVWSVSVTTVGLILLDLTRCNLPWTDHIIFCYKAKIMTIYENINQSNDRLRIKKCKVKSG